MAYKRRSRSAPRRSKKRRSMGAIGKRKESAMRLLGLVGGAVATGILNKYVGTKLDPKILAGLEVAGGYFLPTFIKGDLAAGVGDGMIAAGGMGLLREFGVINGIPIIAGFRELSAVNGTPSKPAQAMNESSASNAFRPSMAQIFNGIYYRRPMD